MKEKIKAVFDWLRRYMSVWTILCLVVAVYIIFYGDSSVFRTVEYERTLDSLNIVLQENLDSAQYYHNLNKRLIEDPKLIEKIVREEYLMKAPDEDVYIFR